MKQQAKEKIHPVKLPKASFNRVKKLVEKYEEIKNSGELKSYSEEQTKKDFILPLFEILGWDVEKMVSTLIFKNQTPVVVPPSAGHYRARN